MLFVAKLTYGASEMIANIREVYLTFFCEKYKIELLYYVQ